MKCMTFAIHARWAVSAHSIAPCGGDDVHGGNRPALPRQHGLSPLVTWLRARCAVHHALDAGRQLPVSLHAVHDAPSSNINLGSVKGVTPTLRRRRPGVVHTVKGSVFRGTRKPHPWLTASSSARCRCWSPLRKPTPGRLRAALAKQAVNPGCLLFSRLRGTRFVSQGCSCLLQDALACQHHTGSFREWGSRGGGCGQRRRKFTEQPVDYSLCVDRCTLCRKRFCFRRLVCLSRDFYPASLEGCRPKLRLFAAGRNGGAKDPGDDLSITFFLNLRCS